MATQKKFFADTGLETSSSLQVDGNATIDGNTTITGNLTVNGTSLTVNATTTSVEDNLFELANSNTAADTLDIGIYGNYDDGLSDGGASEYTGLFRDASDSTWKLFDGLEETPTTTINTSGTGFGLADLQVGDLTATTLTATNGLTGSSITYPTSDGTNGQVIKTNGSGTLTFGDIPAGYADSDVESYLSGGTGVTYSSGAISIGQAVATSDSPTFTDMTLSGTDSIKVPSGTTGQRNGTPVNGMFRYNSTNSEFEGYQNGAWGAIAGGDGGIGGMLQNSYTGDGSTVAFTLSSNPQTENNTQVYIDGVYQNKSTYSTSGTTLTFDTAPENSAEIEVIMFDQTTVDTGSVTTTAIADNAVTIDKLALSDGTTGQFIKTDGSGTMSFASVPAGYTDSDVGTYLSSNGYATQSTVVAAITDSAPATLDTLNELAAALGDDANFSTTVTNSIALKAPLASPVFSGTVDMGTFGNRTRAFEAYGSNVLFDGGSDSIDLIIGDGSSAYMSIQTTDTASAMKIRDYSGNADLVTIERATGKVGIGETTPTNAKLEILQAGDHDAHSTHGIAIHSTGNTNFTSMYMGAEDGIDAAYIQSAALDGSFTSKSLLLNANGGNVGIGTVAPQHELQVFGSQPTLSIRDSTSGGSGTWTLNREIATLNFMTSDTTGIGAHAVAEIKVVSGTNGDATPSGDMTFTTASYNNAAQERMRITYNGIVDITGGSLRLSSVANRGLTYRSGNNDVLLEAAAGLFYRQDIGNTNHSWFTGNSEKMRIDSSGNLLVGKTTSNLTLGGLYVAPNDFMVYTNTSTDTGDRLLVLNRQNATGELVDFRYQNSTVGKITHNGSATSYGTGSDYRLKENVVTDWDATTRLKQLKPSRFNFITDADNTVDGFLAHEVSSVVPEAISGEKDAVDDDDNAVYQGIDQSKLVPLLVKTIQELEARVTALEG